MRVIILGPPGAGKGTQSSNICEKFDIVHISTGDIFRYHIKNMTELGKKVKNYLNQGLLVPDELTDSIVEDRLFQDDVKNGFLLDGYPRNIHQADFLKEILYKHNIKIDCVINLLCDDEILIKRIVSRRVCKNCGETYNLEFKPPKKENICDKCGGELYQRTDDIEETVKERITSYNRETKPLIDYYSKEGLLHNVDGMQSLDLVFSQIEQILRTKL